MPLNGVSDEYESDYIKAYTFPFFKASLTIRISIIARLMKGPQQDSTLEPSSTEGGWEAKSWILISDLRQAGTVHALFASTRFLCKFWTQLQPIIIESHQLSR